MTMRVNSTDSSYVFKTVDGYFVHVNNKILNCFESNDEKEAFIKMSKENKVRYLKSKRFKLSDIQNDSVNAVLRAVKINDSVRSKYEY